MLRRIAVLDVLEDLCQLSLGSEIAEMLSFTKDQAEELPDRTATAVRPLEEEKAQLFADEMLELSWALLKDPWLLG